ncbi:hypothetical protein TRFO_40857 [Tritrichomonas foetus]|uniref:Uncharacterized protein n=1 Tax=Tritrichomonas foetus TaxID=1144522 RepID=A0A1J4IZP1_9EUKA|nr:hypothetical protein TRFO_40857 [Tritrichomonas foetus]|eukprot:OHS92816.1 hypothetical protein TRFO_40857 [Tritrichomonas foetus]
MESTIDNDVFMNSPQASQPGFDHGDNSHGNNDDTHGNNENNNVNNNNNNDDGHENENTGNEEVNEDEGVELIK